MPFFLLNSRFNIHNERIQSLFINIIFHFLAQLIHEIRQKKKEMIQSPRLKKNRVEKENLPSLNVKKTMIESNELKIEKENVKPNRICNIETVMIEVDSVPTSQNDVDSCIASAIHMHKGTKLGSGDNADAFRIAEDPTHVIKVAKLSTKRVTDLWRNEACVGRALGELGIAPKIEKVFECNNFGYIVMDLLYDAKKLEDGTVIREKYVDEEKGDRYPIDHVGRMPQEMQWKFIEDFKIMADHGYIHMDNHIENLGFIGTKRKPIVFDFGFTQNRNSMTESDKLWALCFSLFQVLEHTPKDELICGPFWDVATAILRNDESVKWSNLNSCKGMTLKELATSYPKPRKDTLKLIKQAAAGIAPMNADLVVGSMCYGICVQEPLEERHNDPYLAVIYKIRQGKKY